MAYVVRSGENVGRTGLPVPEEATTSLYTAVVDPWTELAIHSLIEVLDDQYAKHCDEPRSRHEYAAAEPALTETHHWIDGKR